jgi:hypothetical protein
MGGEDHLAKTLSRQGELEQEHQSKGRSKGGGSNAAEFLTAASVAAGR